MRTLEATCFTRNCGPLNLGQPTFWSPGRCTSNNIIVASSELLWHLHCPVVVFTHCSLNPSRSLAIVFTGRSNHSFSDIFTLLYSPKEPNMRVSIATFAFLACAGFTSAATECAQKANEKPTAGILAVRQPNATSIVPAGTPYTIVWDVRTHPPYFLFPDVIADALPYRKQPASPAFQSSSA